MGALHSKENCNYILVIFLRGLLADLPKIQVCIKEEAIVNVSPILQPKEQLKLYSLPPKLNIEPLSECFVSCLVYPWICMFWKQQTCIVD